MKVVHTTGPYKIVDDLPAGEYMVLMDGEDVKDLLELVQRSDFKGIGALYVKQEKGVVGSLYGVIGYPRPNKELIKII